MADYVPLGISCPRRTEYINKLSEVIKNSSQIAKEPIKKYRLNTKKETLDKDGLVRRCTFGKKDPTKKKKTILMVGETGAGKSTLINRMLNYMLGVKWEDDVRFEIIVDEGERPQTESQTDAITAYEIYGVEELMIPFSLTIIDTPGYGDTRGIEHDKHIAENLYTLMKSFSGVQQLDAACLVVKASVNRLNFSQDYIFDAVLSLFGKNMEKNIIPLVTHSDWTPPLALNAIIEAGVPCAKDKEEYEPVYFLLNNPPFQKCARRFEKAYKANWENGEDSLREFFQRLNQMDSQSLQMTEHVLKQRLMLEAAIPSLIEQAKNAELTLNALESAKKSLEQHREDMKNNKNFPLTREVAIITEESINYTVTRCTVCKVNCHCRGCWWVSDLRWCSVMKDNKCTVCPQECHYTKHEKGYIKYVHKLEKRTETYEDLKTKEKVQTAELIMARQQGELEKAKVKMKKLQDRAFNCVVELSNYALKFHTDSIKQYIDSLIHMLKMEKDTERAKILEDMLNKTVFHTCFQQLHI